MHGGWTRQCAFCRHSWWYENINTGIAFSLKRHHPKCSHTRVAMRKHILVWKRTSRKKSRHHRNRWCIHLFDIVTTAEIDFSMSLFHGYWNKSTGLLCFNCPGKTSPRLRLRLKPMLFQWHPVGLVVLLAERHDYLMPLTYYLAVMVKEADHHLMMPPTTVVMLPLPVKASGSASGGWILLELVIFISCVCDDGDALTQFMNENDVICVRPRSSFKLSIYRFCLPKRQVEGLKNSRADRDGSIVVLQTASLFVLQERREESKQ